LHFHAELVTHNLVIWCQGLYHLQFVWLDSQPLTKNTPYDFLGQLQLTTGSVRGFFGGLLWKLLWFYRHPLLIHVAALCSSFYTQNQSLRTDCTNGRYSSEMVVLYQNVCGNAVVLLWWNLSLLTPTHNTPYAGHSPFCHTSAPDGPAASARQVRINRWEFSCPLMLYTFFCHK
jgi:hypothetical protein